MNIVTKNWIGRLAGFAGLVLALALMASPRQADAQVRIMPLGDSLTSSIEGQASYRYWLYHMLVEAGYNVDFVGTLWGVGGGESGIYGDFDQNHEGHLGATTSDILEGVVGWASETQPDIVLLLIGANDFEQGKSPSVAINNTQKIVKALRSVNPNVCVVIGMLPPGRDMLSKVQAYNSALLQQAPSWSKRNSPIKIANLYSNFYPKKDTVDGEHPNATGEQKFAKRFFRPLSVLLRR